MPGAERRKDGRSQSGRSVAAGIAAGAVPAAAHPDPEVVARAKRRTFTAEYKLRVLAESEQAKHSGSLGALLRREGLYSSHLVSWRRERTAGILQGLTPLKRGPKSQLNPLLEENQKLLHAVQRLTEQLRKAEIIIDVQKKVAALLDLPADPISPEVMS
jgi:transposase-like protein